MLTENMKLLDQRKNTLLLPEIAVDRVISIFAVSGASFPIESHEEDY